MDPRRAKWLLLRAFGATQPGCRLYWWLTAGLLGTRRNMPAKWCQWFREHVVLARRYAGLAMHDPNLWVVGPDFTVAPALLCRLLSDGDILLTDRWRRLRHQYTPLALRAIRKRFPDMARWIQRDGDRLAVLPSPRTARSREVLDRIGARYRAPLDGAIAEAPSASVDLCVSMGALEHYPPTALRTLVAEMARVVRPGGAVSHIVDHRDHLWHVAPSGDCFHHLRCPDDWWHRIERNPLLYTNRLLRSDYLTVLTDAEFEVRYAGYGLHVPDTANVRRDLLWGRYREATAEDLRAAVSHFVAVRR